MPTSPSPISASARAVSPFDAVEVRDGDLVLRTLETADAPALFRLIDADRERLGRWLPWVEETRTEADTVRFILDATDERRRRRSLVLGVAVDDVLVGTLGLHYLDWFDRSAELGYWIAAPLEGRGYVVRASRRMLALAFESAGLHRIVIRCAVDNLRSRRVAERLGFRVEGLLREAQWVGGRFLDQHLFALLRRDFRR
jgi:ribosomal-protein-serine acetyltransferase